MAPLVLDLVGVQTHRGGLAAVRWLIVIGAAKALKSLWQRFFCIKPTNDKRGGFSKLAPSHSFRERERWEGEMRERPTRMTQLSITCLLIRPIWSWFSSAPPRTAHQTVLPRVSTYIHTLSAPIVRPGFETWMLLSQDGIASGAKYNANSRQPLI